MDVFLENLNITRRFKTHEEENVISIKLDRCSIGELKSAKLANISKEE